MIDNELLNGISETIAIHNNELKAEPNSINDFIIEDLLESLGYNKRKDITVKRIYNDILSWKIDKRIGIIVLTQDSIDDKKISDIVTNFDCDILLGVSYNSIFMYRYKDNGFNKVYIINLTNTLSNTDIEVLRTLSKDEYNIEEFDERFSASNVTLEDLRNNLKSFSNEVINILSETGKFIINENNKNICIELFNNILSNDTKSSSNTENIGKAEDIKIYREKIRELSERNAILEDNNKKLISENQKLSDEVNNLEGIEDRKADQLLNIIKDDKTSSRKYVAVINSELNQYNTIYELIGRSMQMLVNLKGLEASQYIFNSDTFQLIDEPVRNDVIMNNKGYDIDINADTIQENEVNYINRLYILFSHFEDIKFRCKTIGTFNNKSEEKINNTEEVKEETELKEIKEHLPEINVDTDGEKTEDDLGDAIDLDDAIDFEDEETEEEAEDEEGAEDEDNLDNAIDFGDEEDMTEFDGEETEEEEEAEDEEEEADDEEDMTEFDDEETEDKEDMTEFDDEETEGEIEDELLNINVSPEDLVEETSPEDLVEETSPEDEEETSPEDEEGTSPEDLVEEISPEDLVEVIDGDMCAIQFDELADHIWDKDLEFGEIQYISNDTPDNPISDLMFRINESDLNRSTIKEIDALLAIGVKTNVDEDTNIISLIRKIDLSEVNNFIKLLGDDNKGATRINNTKYVILPLDDIRKAYTIIKNIADALNINTTNTFLYMEISSETEKGKRFIEEHKFSEEDIVLYDNIEYIKPDDYDEETDANDAVAIIRGDLFDNIVVTMNSINAMSKIVKHTIAVKSPDIGVVLRDSESVSAAIISLINSGINSGREIDAARIGNVLGESYRIISFDESNVREEHVSIETKNGTIYISELEQWQILHAMIKLQSAIYNNKNIVLKSIIDVDALNFYGTEFRTVEPSLSVAVQSFTDYISNHIRRE